MDYKQTEGITFRIRCRAYSSLALKQSLGVSSGQIIVLTLRYWRKTGTVFAKYYWLLLAR
jgi:hypothetical protein